MPIVDPTLFQKALELKNQGLSNCQVAKELNVSEGTFRYWLKKNL
jgi:orotate phosphoribosyltransferase-like protein